MISGGQLPPSIWHDFFTFLARCSRSWSRFHPPSGRRTTDNLHTYVIVNVVFSFQVQVRATQTTCMFSNTLMWMSITTSLNTAINCLQSSTLDHVLWAHALYLDVWKDEHQCQVCASNADGERSMARTPTHVNEHDWCIGHCLDTSLIPWRLSVKNYWHHVLGPLVHFFLTNTGYGWASSSPRAPSIELSWYKVCLQTGYEWNKSHTDDKRVPDMHIALM